MDFEFQKCPIFVGSLQNPAASNQKGFYTKITQNSSVYLGFDAEVPQKILQGLYCNSTALQKWVLANVTKKDLNMY